MRNLQNEPADAVMLTSVYDHREIAPKLRYINCVFKHRPLYKEGRLQFLVSIALKRNSLRR